MAQQVSGIVGPQNYPKGSGSVAIPRLNNFGETAVSEILPQYAQTTLDGISISAANQAAQAVSVALATTYTGLLLYNPVGSGIIVVPKFIKFALSVAPAGIATIGLIGGFAATGGVTAQTTPLTKQVTLIGSTKPSSAIALSAATIVTPTWIEHIWDGFTAAAFPAPQTPYDCKGDIALLPGAFIAIGALTAITGLGSITWDELPLAPNS